MARRMPQPTSGAGPVNASASIKVSRSSSYGIVPSLSTSTVGSVLALFAALTLVAKRIGRYVPCNMPGEVHLLLLLAQR